MGKLIKHRDARFREAVTDNGSSPKSWYCGISAIKDGLAYRGMQRYISSMPKRTPREKLFEWRITRIRATPALIGYVQAPDAEQAVKEAIARYWIDNPQEQARLAVQRVKEIG